MLKHPADVFTRFKEEQKNIRAFVSVTDEFMRPNDSTINKLNSTLQHCKLRTFNVRADDRLHKQFDDEEFQTLIDTMDQFEGPISNKIHELEKTLYRVDERMLDAGEALDPDGSELRAKWAKYYILHNRPSGIEDADEAWFAKLFDDYTQYTGEFNDDKAEFSKFFQFLSFRSKAQQVSSLAARLEMLRETFSRLRVAHRMRDPNADVNILRQGFLLLMTAFDAAVFDIIRVAMRRDFFKLIARFGKKEVIPVTQWDKFGTVEEFQNRMIERSLKGFYLKDLLEAIRKMGVATTKETTDLSRLTEMIQRRNLHVHNRGFVDERYLETDDEGVPRFNIDKLALGEMAIIDQNYVDKTLKLTMECIELLRDWIMAGSPIKTT